jgi:hypothetical protein
MKTAALFAAFLSVAAVTASAASADEGTWRWIWVRPDDQKGWITLQGEAPVRFDGQRLDLRVEGRPSIHVQGRVTGKAANATLTQLNTDASPERYAGRYQRDRSGRGDPANGWGEDRISLFDGQSYFSLYRTVRSER